MESHIQVLQNVTTFCKIICLVLMSQPSRRLGMFEFDKQEQLAAKLTLFRELLGLFFAYLLLSASDLWRYPATAFRWESSNDM